MIDINIPLLSGYIDSSKST